MSKLFSFKKTVSSEEKKEFKSLRDYTNKELLSHLDRNNTTNLQLLAGFISEILRRMNDIKPLLDDGTQISDISPGVNHISLSLNQESQ